MFDRGVHLQQDCASRHEDRMSRAGRAASGPMDGFTPVRLGNTTVKHADYTRILCQIKASYCEKAIAYLQVAE